MRAPLDLRLVEADFAADVEAPLSVDAGQEAPPPPRVFARAILAPPGWPWEQAGGAQLAARHEAPLPLDQLSLRLRRLTPWRPTQSALFAACYVRAADIQERFEAQIEVEGHQVQVVFEPPQAQARRAQRSLVVGVAAAVIGGLLFVAIGGALLARAQGEALLATMERDAAVKLRRAEAVQLIQRQSAALAVASPGDTLASPLADLDWAMAARSPDARIEAWRWDHGVSRIEARGETPPFVDPRRILTREGEASSGASRWRIAPEGAPQ